MPLFSPAPRFCLPRATGAADFSGVTHLPATAAAIIRRHTELHPGWGIVLGSGFAALAEAVEDAVSLAYGELPGFAPSTVSGHAGRLVLGRLGGTPVAVLAGRAHFYEGHDLATVTFPVRVLAALGIHSLLLTNAAGGIRADLEPGDFVALTDHLNFLGGNPLRGPGGGERFVDLSECYCPALRARLHTAARRTGLSLKEGVYAAVSGPSYETPAEIRAFARLGADLVGMSTVPEAIVGRQSGLAVAALSCVTNRAAGLGGRISHAEVLDIGRRTAAAAGRLVTAFLTEPTAAA